MYVRSMSNWTEWVQWTPSCPIVPTRVSYESSYTFVNRDAANILLVLGYRIRHEVAAEGQAMVFRSNHEFVLVFN